MEDLVPIFRLEVDMYYRDNLEFGTKDLDLIRGGMKMLMEEMTTNEVEAALKTCRTVIIPFGVMEAHGSHLPLATDTYQAYDASRRVAKEIDVFVTPPVHYGICRSAAGHSGTISISGETLRALTKDILLSLIKFNFRNFILLSGHASTLQLAALEEASEVVIRDHKNINIAVVSDMHVIIDKAAKVIETKGDIHGGEVETSRMMYIKPDLVRKDKFPTEANKNFPTPILVRNTKKYWQKSIIGNPKLASVKKGQIFTETSVQYLLGLINKMNSFEPD
jgi:creatinine amidohydrolase